MTRETLQVRVIRELSVILWYFPRQYQYAHKSKGAWLHSAARSLPEPCMSQIENVKNNWVSLSATSSKTIVRTFSCASSSSAAITYLSCSDSGSSERKCRSLEALLEKYDWIFVHCEQFCPLLVVRIKHAARHFHWVKFQSCFLTKLKFPFQIPLLSFTKPCLLVTCSKSPPLWKNLSCCGALMWHTLNKRQKSYKTKATNRSQQTSAERAIFESCGTKTIKGGGTKTIKGGVSEEKRTRAKW